MNQIIAIALGGSVGALARFLIANSIYSWFGRSFPIGTLFVNVSGCFVMGFLTALLMQRFAMVIELRAALLVGFLGAYTTFSTFAIETLYLFEEGNLQKAFLNIFLSVVLCLEAVWIGLVTGRRIFAIDTFPDFNDLFHVKMLIACMVYFLISSFIEFFLQRFSIAQEWRLIALALLLALVTISVSLLYIRYQYNFQLDFQQTIGILIITNLFSILLIWAGSLFGNWLCQYIP